MKDFGVSRVTQGCSFTERSKRHSMVVRQCQRSLYRAEKLMARMPLATKRRSGFGDQLLAEAAGVLEQRQGRVRALPLIQQCADAAQGVGPVSLLLIVSGQRQVSFRQKALGFPTRCAL